MTFSYLEKQVNHHGKSITVGGNKDSDMDPLVERVIQSEKKRIRITLTMKVYSMDPNGFTTSTGRPGTGRVSREAFATMTQVHSLYTLPGLQTLVSG